MDKILVCIKRVVDYNVKIRIKRDETDVVTEGVKMSINPFDEIALEEALRIKESGQADEVIIVSVGPNDCQQQLRTGLAMGADRAILIEHSENTEPLTVAKLLHQIVQQEQPKLILLGKQAIDDDCNQTGQMLSSLLGWAQGTFASKIEVKDKSIQVTREVDEGLETIEINLPAIVTCDLRLNEPRYASLPNIMKAKKKPIEQLIAKDLGVDISNRTQQLKVEEPPKRRGGVKVANVAELVSKLKNEAKVI